MLTYVIGDIHGCYEELDKVLDWIKSDIDTQEYQVIFLGDYVDRGPRSKDVIERLIKETEQDKKIRCILGNHDIMLLGYMGCEKYDSYPGWANTYGYNTLVSYGKKGVSRKHFNWLSSLPIFIEDEYRIYVHAGLDPKNPLDRSAATITWIRQGFIDVKHDFGKIVIYGHTPYNNVHVDEYKVGFDCGCVFGNKLAIGKFKDNDLETIHYIPSLSSKKLDEIFQNGNFKKW